MCTIAVFTGLLGAEWDGPCSCYRSTGSRNRDDESTASIFAVDQTVAIPDEQVIRSAGATIQRYLDGPLVA
jgi:hypothetical protein